MNPLLYKVHPLLARWMDLFNNPGAQSTENLIYLAVVLLSSNLLWTIGLPSLLNKTEGLKIGPLLTYLIVLPANFLYSPLMLTLLRDVLNHSFEFRDRWFLLFALLASSQLLTALYAFTLRHERSGRAIGLEAGLAVSMFLLLISIPACLILLGADALWSIF